MRNEAVNQVFLEVVWSALCKNEWLSSSELKAASGADDKTLTRIVDFLVRWNFAEVRRSPSLHVRRKSGAISPTEVVGLLRTINETSQAIPVDLKRAFRFAERVACRICGGRGLSLIGENEVECVKCHERQWYAIVVPGSKHVAFSDLLA
jgi:hypothetical protein